MSDGLPENWAAGRQALRQTMLARVRPNQPHTDHVLSAINRVCDVSDQFHRERAKIAQNDKLSTTGRKAETAALVRTKLMPEIARAMRPIRKALSHFEAQRAGLQKGLLQVEPNDMVGELRRQEVRTYLRGLPPGERMQAALQIIEDDAGAAAILDAAPVMTGLAEPFYRQLRDTVSQRVNGPELSRLSELSGDYENAKATADVILQDLIPASGLTTEAFREEMTPLEAEADA